MSGRKLFIFSLFVFTVISELSGQQFPIYSQYWMNKFLLNPAVAGHEGYTSINATAHQQWVGLKDAPSTYAISGQTRLLKNSFISRSRSIRRRRKVMSRSGRVGLGGYVFNDNSGAFMKTGFQGTYGYHLVLRRAQLSFGASVTGYQYKIDRDKIVTEEEEPLLKLSQDQAYVTDANFGVYYSDKSIYAGLAAQNLFESFFKLNNREGAGFQLERHYLLMAGYRYDVIDFVFMEPSFLIKFSEAYARQLDLTLNFYFKEDYWGGISFRTGGGPRVATESIRGRGSSIIIFGGARIDKFFAGYAFDYSFSSISRKTWGSHELMLGVKFGDNARRYRWLNRY